MNIPEAAFTAAMSAHTAALMDLIFAEGSVGFKRAKHHRLSIRAALEAAAPIVAAETLRDAAAYINSNIKAGADDPVSPDETAQWLLRRATQIEQGS